MIHVFLGVLCSLLMLITVLKIYFNRKGPKRVSRFLAKHHVAIIAVMMIAVIAHITIDLTVA